MKESKKLLIGFGIVGVLCLCAAGVSFFAFREFSKRMENIISTDPASVEQVKQNIADFDTPEGYAPTVMSFLVYDMIDLRSEDYANRTNIIMLQSNTFLSGNSEQVKAQLRQAMERQNNNPGMSMKLVDTYHEVIRGETVNVTISEGSTQNITMRQLLTIFTGNRGLVILMIQGPVEDWDDQFAEDFIASIR